MLRALAFSLGLLLGCSIQASERVARIGIVASGPTERWTLIAQAVRSGLAQHGYVEGRNVVLVERYVAHPGTPVHGRSEMGQAVDALLAADVQAIVAGCGWSLRTLMDRTRTLPVVMASVTDPVRQGFVESLARPGGNVTGVTGGAGGLGPKMLEQLRIALPQAGAVGVIYNTANRAHHARFEEVAAAARTMALRVQPIPLTEFADFAAAVGSLRKAALDALLILPDDGSFWGYVDRIVRASAALRLPAIYPRRDLVEMGGMMSFGSNDREVFRRTGSYLDRILGGTPPARLPVEHPRETEFVIDAGRAGAYGLAIDRAALIRADAVIR